ncbi:MAG: hypothetical protein GOMPHAMPRED_006580 [Gomphillus americanus]|uniref:Mitochondrial resolvase Ydc2 catalytic domain-containing protein n=1 Tax=Gomphillus americanus TaxID=1940652 RepID=A0A8H3IU89_9LECA|nr:MAG: hypothetical protein GOMPHAMPRED_006580 [Gomphillus americanus]
MTLPINFKLLADKLKATQLTRLARLTGVNSSSKTKAAIAQSLQSIVDASSRDHADRTQPVRIASIDVGLKNLAYCVIEHPNGGSTPLIRAWRRLDLSGKDGIEDKLNATRSFSNQDLARVAVNLIHNIILEQSVLERPSHVLIEQQRWRSGGGPNVFQWTVRVNTFEAMLWAVTTTFKQQGIWNGQVHAVNPAQVAALWLENQRQKGLSVQQKYRDLKFAKLRLLRDWTTEERLVSSGCAESDVVFEALRDGSATDGKRRMKKGSETPELAKLDDLADCLIQGVTWLQWLGNRRLLAEKGEEGVRELLDRESAPRMHYR